MKIVLINFTTDNDKKQQTGSCRYNPGKAMEMEHKVNKKNILQKFYPEIRYLRIVVFENNLLGSFALIFTNPTHGRNNLNNNANANNKKNLKT